MIFVEKVVLVRRIAKDPHNAKNSEHVKQRHKIFLVVLLFLVIHIPVIIIISTNIVTIKIITINLVTHAKNVLI